ncbi:hypothetical protein ASPBRDRAFT_73366 [Aspergillus brasiliensis CBS 101740]|uniref:Uncharacterized protein n=1 Tax=Aspergillus brasiliensis (strain CBS 101740 / IMI 381727 / IBT 21946) TaxID=767769 RepID=A0A1L9UU16_ASPBC|nr:hypothetical protein ASPBRDRAFT_73366 [Aspergillus brasiliensis CBS 101740]
MGRVELLAYRPVESRQMVVGQVLLGTAAMRAAINWRTRSPWQDEQRSLVVARKSPDTNEIGRRSRYKRCFSNGGDSMDETDDAAGFNGVAIDEKEEETRDAAEGLRTLLRSSYVVSLSIFMNNAVYIEIHLVESFCREYTKESLQYTKFQTWLSPSSSASKLSPEAIMKQPVRRATGVLVPGQCDQ